MQAWKRKKGQRGRAPRRGPHSWVLVLGLGKVTSPGALSPPSARPPAGLAQGSPPAACAAPEWPPEGAGGPPKRGERAWAGRARGQRVPSAVGVVRACVWGSARGMRRGAKATVPGRESWKAAPPPLLLEPFSPRALRVRTRFPRSARRRPGRGAEARGGPARAHTAPRPRAWFPGPRGGGGREGCPGGRAPQ